MKENIDLDSLGVKVNELRQMKRGAISMSVGKGVEGAKAAEKLKTAVEAVLGSGVGIQLHTNTTRLEITGISSEDDKRDNIEGLAREDVPASQAAIK